MKKPNPNTIQHTRKEFKTTGGDDLILTRPASILTLGLGEDGLERKGSIKKFTLKRSHSKLRLELKEEPKPTGPEIYWPVDLLPESCPNIRILTWGFLTLTTNGKLRPAQNDVFANARELFRDLIYFRDETSTLNRPIVFIAHSTGGIIVKEVRVISKLAWSTCLKGAGTSLSRFGRVGIQRYLVINISGPLLWVPSS